MENFTRDKHDCCNIVAVISQYHTYIAGTIFIENRNWNNGVTPGVRSESAKCLFKVSSLSNWFCYHMSIVDTIHTEGIQRYRRMCTTRSRIFDVVPRFVEFSSKTFYFYFDWRSNLFWEFKKKSNFFSKSSFNRCNRNGDKQAQLFQYQLHNNVRLLHMQEHQRVLVKRLFQTRNKLALGHFSM